MSTTSLPRVLVIDGDAGVCQCVAALLEPYGYDCQSAGDGGRGLARLDEGGWDLVLAALGMPELNGRDIVEAIHRRAPTMPIVLMAGPSDPDVAPEDGAPGIPVIRKPFPSLALTSAVVKALYTKPA